MKIYDGSIGGIRDAMPEEEAAITAFQNEIANNPVPRQKVSATVATAKLSISDGIVEGIGVDSAFAGVFQIDTGYFWVAFMSSQPDTDYIVNAFDGGLFRCYVKPEDYQPDGFAISTTDLSGVPGDPQTISVIVTRAI